MNDRRGLPALAATVIADSCWLYTVIGLLGLATNQGGPAVPWAGVLAILAAMVAATRLLVRAYGAARASHAGLGAVGLVAIYVAIAAVLDPADGAWEPVWINRMMTGAYSGPQVVRIVGTAIGVAWLCRRAIRIGDEPNLDVRLLSTFRTGTMVIAIVLIVERVASTDLHATSVILPFYAVCLCGLAVSRRPRSAALSPAWMKVAGGTVGAVLGIAFLLGLFGERLGGSMVHAIAGSWTWLAQMIGQAVGFIMAPFLELLFWIVEMLKPERPAGPPPTILRPPVSWEFIDPANTPAFVDAVVAFVKYPLLILLLFFLIRFLIRSHRLWATGRDASPVTVDHETIERDGDAMTDLAHIVETLLPDWLRGRKGRPGWRVPAGDPGIADVFRLYFEMLEAAMTRGHPADPASTPNERAPRLAALLPEAPVARITACFNAACFGARPTDAGTIRALRADLQRTAAT